VAIRWRQDLEIGIEKIDDQHKELVDSMNNLLEACSAGRAKEEIEKTLAFISDYVVTHFNYEQEYLQKYGYPKYDAHVKLHKFFLQEIEELNKKYEEEGPTLHFIVVFNKKILDWFINHIGKADRDFAEYLRSSGKIS